MTSSLIHYLNLYVRTYKGQGKESVWSSDCVPYYSQTAHVTLTAAQHNKLNGSPRSCEIFKFVCLPNNGNNAKMIQSLIILIVLTRTSRINTVELCSIKAMSDVVLEKKK